jgi:hypothetical protein
MNGPLVLTEHSIIKATQQRWIISIKRLVLRSNSNAMNHFVSRNTVLILFSDPLLVMFGKQPRLDQIVFIAIGVSFPTGVSTD